MRTLTAETQALLATREALEPIFVVGVQWVMGGAITYYCDKVSEGIAGKIMEVSGFDSTTRLDGGGSSSQVSIKLIDIDGTLKTIYNTTDIHKRNVYLYQWFYGMPLQDAFLVASGCISSPIVWEESSRTLAFDLVSRLENYEVGFSLEESVFGLGDMKLMGMAWPMIFGTVFHTPGIQLQEIPGAFTKTHMGFPDESLLYEASRHGRSAVNHQMLADLYAMYAAWNCLGRGIFPCEDNSEYMTFMNQARQHADQVGAQRNEAAERLQTYLEQSRYPRSAELVPSTQVTWPFSGKMRVGNTILNGWLNNRDGRVIGPPTINRFVPPPLEAGDGTSAVPPKSEKRGFQFIQAGTQVSIADNYSIAFLVSMVPGTVSSVWAYRNLNGIKSLTKVPSDWYTVGEIGTGLTSGNGVTVILNMPLSVRGYLQQEGINNWESGYGAGLPQHVSHTIDWEDQIYVTFHSSVGPNTVDIIKWVLQHYCPGLTYDETTFAIVREQIANYHMNFSYTSRTDAIKFIQELAYQARCAVWIDTDIVYIKYLAVEEEAVDTITLDDIVEDSITVSSTSTEDLITKYTGTYLSDHLPMHSTPVQVVLRHNIKKYGTQAEEYNYFAYMSYRYVEKSATFWMIRRANTWKLFRCKLFITKLNIETMDTVWLDFDDKNYISYEPIKAIVNSAIYNTDDNTIDVEFWCPVKLGEMDKYEFAWPAGASISAHFPTIRELQAGSGGGLNGGRVKLPPNNSSNSGGSAHSDMFPPGDGKTIEERRADHAAKLKQESDARNKIRAEEDAAEQEANDQFWADYDANQAALAQQVARFTPEEIYFPTYGDPTPSDLDDSPVVTTQYIPDDPEFITTPEFDYEYEDIENPEFEGSVPALEVFPCKIMDRGVTEEELAPGFQAYNVIVYRQGLDGPGRNMVGTVQMQIDKDDQIPQGTMTHVVINNWSDDDGQHTSATIQVPVWLV